MNMHSYQTANPMMSNVSYQQGFQGQNPQNQPQPNMMMPGVTIVNQTPITNSTFPISYQSNSVLAVSILKIIIGFIQFVIGIADAVVLPYYWTSYIAFPIWCGVLFIINGVIGCLTFKWPTKCMIGSFLGLSITSLILSVSMLPIFSIALSYFVDPPWYYSCGYYGCNYYKSISWYTQDVGTGLSGFVVFLICFELSLSIAAVVYSCKAYSKCCNTCNANDCCACVGCCECDQQTSQYMVHSDYPMRSVNAANVNQERQHLISATSQSNQSSNPCSALVNVIISFPGISHAINAASISNSATEEPNTVQITIQGNNSNQQANAPPQEAANAPIISQGAGAAAQIHIPQGNLHGFGEQQQAPPSYSLK